MEAHDSIGARLLPAPAVAGQLGRFALVGVTNTALSWGLFALALSLGVWYPLASALAFVAGAINGYTLNRIWTFKAGRFCATGLARYSCVQALGLGVNELVIVVVVELAGVPHLAAQAVALGAVSLLTFSLNRRWAFAVRT